MSLFEVYRRKHNPALPASLKGLGFKLEAGELTTPIADADKISELFPKTTNLPLLNIIASDEDAKVNDPLRIGVIFSGGQAPGGHNVLCGLYDKLQTVAPGSKLLGFLNGPKGLMEGKFIELTAEYLSKYRNMGGFHAIGSGRDKIAKPEHFEAAAATAQRENLDGLVIIGGDDSNTNACVLAEDFLNRGLKTCVVGCPKTIDRDLMSAKGIETSFGFDTTTKVFSELIGNLCFDALSAKKYWHFIRLMGRSASHITLECALQTHPNVTLIGEDIADRKVSLAELYETVAEAVIRRAETGKNFGICLIPEGLIEFVPEMNRLFNTLNNKILCNWKVEEKGDVTPEKVAELLDEQDRAAFLSIPSNVRYQLLLDRDPHGNIAISQIETEKFLAAGVSSLLKSEKYAARIKAIKSFKFSPLFHFFGYEGRCAPPSNFDASYCYGLGSVAAVLLEQKKTGYMASLTHLAQPPAEWKPIGLPLTALMNIEVRHGEETPVIQKQMVDLKGRPLAMLFCNREKWLMNDEYRQPGAVQVIEADNQEAIDLAAMPSMCLLEEARGI